AVPRPPWRSTNRLAPRWSRLGFLRPGMRLPVDVEQLRDVDVRVSLCRRETHVAQQFLNGAQVGARLQQMGGKRGPQRVRADPESRAAARHVTCHQPLYAPAGQSSAPCVDKERCPII